MKEEIGEPIARRPVEWLAAPPQPTSFDDFGRGEGGIGICLLISRPGEPFFTCVCPRPASHSCLISRLDVDINFSPDRRSVDPIEEEEKEMGGGKKKEKMKIEMKRKKMV